MRLLTILLLVFCPILVQADIYKFVDDEGNVTYTNMPRPGAKKLVTETAQPAGKSSDAAEPTTSKKRTRGKATTPAYFPKVDPGTQRRRDDMRRQILQEELDGEQRNLSAAQAALANANRTPGADLKRFSDAVRAHQRNIEMLNKELSHIR